MKRYRIIIKPTAEQDLAQCYQQIAQDSPQYAFAWYSTLIEAIEALDVMAERCPIAPEDAEIQQGIRHLVAGKYRVLYRINGQDVEVLHVRHGAHALML